VIRTCKANVLHLDKIIALWMWLNAGKSNDLRTHAFSTGTKSQGERVTE